MARAETGHIHLGSSILHHTEGWETKSWEKKAGTHRTTRTARSTPVCTHARKHTNKEIELLRGACLLPIHMQPCSVQYRNLQNQEMHTL